MHWKIFDIVGPVMIGPSSSHTSGAVRLGLLANKIIGGIPDKALIYLHGSYAQVYKGHGTDISLVAGLLGISPDDENMINAFKLASKAGLDFQIATIDLGDEYHSNTVKFVLTKNENEIELIGSSIGGGNVEIVEINGIKTASLNGKSNVLITFQEDKAGVIANIAGILSKFEINIGSMNTTRNHKGGEALTIYNLDNPVKSDIQKQINHTQNIRWVRTLPKLY
ncbi:L-serine ammonia-lyase, iron-sulfur-dependent, subunit beta [Candidatus Dojkabacteria bacterium]|nr:L-serine ammonia-lyase, iron-sulfur-dependent, subunit beta [Candidatus Dojkabacteria bacterium]